jgi:hypothetical protein
MTRIALSTIAWAFVAGLFGGCGDKKDWNSEIIVQLFRPATTGGVDIGSVSIKATQGQATKTKDFSDTAALFSDCTSNQVRIIPVDPASGVDIALTFGRLQVIEFKRTIAPDASKAVLLGLGPSTTSSWQPGPCPGGTPDAVVALRNPTGSACTVKTECAGDMCLAKLTNQSTEYRLQGNYCTAECAVDGTPCDTKAGGGECLVLRYPDGKISGSYCMQICGAPTDCRSGYACTPNGLCFPE